MDPERWKQVNALFEATLNVAPESRSRFLDESCSGDRELRAEVESLLDSDDESWDLLDKPVIELAAPLFEDNSPRLRPDDKLGRYRVVRMIGEGGMGEVYLAIDETLNREVAIKLLPLDQTQNTSRLRRFEEEARAASALNHPNILTIYEFGEVAGHQFIVSEFIQGETLRDLIRRGPAPLAEFVNIALQTGQALSAAHRAGLVHRDIKPENVMIRTDGYVKVLDFGLAKLIEETDLAPDHDDTGDGVEASHLLLGTARYMSPEQTRGDEVDHCSDLFSLGVMMYEMLAGRPPFVGENTFEVIKAVQEKQPSPLNVGPPAARRIIMKALEKHKEARYQSVEDLLVDLRTIGQTAASDRRYLTPALGLGVLLLILIVVVFALRTNIGSRSFSTLAKMTRVPNTDHALDVAIAPDGESLAEVTDIPGGKAIFLVELLTDASTQLITVPLADNVYNIGFYKDGKSLWFVTAKGLNKIPASGGDASLVLPNIDCEESSLSSDGTRLACVKHSKTRDELDVIGIGDGTVRLLAARDRPENLSTPSWSPDDTRIAFSTGSDSVRPGQVVSVIDLSTGNEKKINAQGFAQFESMVWLPDASGIIAAAKETDKDTVQVWRISYPEGAVTRITTDMEDYASIGISGDGRKIATLDSKVRSSIWLVPAADPTSARPLPTGEHHQYLHLAWTTSGKVVFASSTAGLRDIWTMEADGTGEKQLTENAGVNQQPDTCPDGRYIVFSSNRANEEIFDIWRMNTDGTGAVQLTHDLSAGQPVCSPDGRWVVFSQGGPNTTPGQKHLWKVPLDGGTPEKLSDYPASGAAISPDGTTIACWLKSDPAKEMTLALLPFNGGDPKQNFAVTRTTIAPVRWEADGRSVDYINTQQGVNNIWSQPISGGAPHPLTKFTSEYIGGFTWGPEGQLFCSRVHTVHDVVLLTGFE